MNEAHVVVDALVMSRRRARARHSIVFSSFASILNQDLKRRVSMLKKNKKRMKKKIEKLEKEKNNSKKKKKKLKKKMNE